MLFQLLKGLFVFGWPYKSSDLFGQRIEGLYDLWEIAYEPTVEIAKPHKCLYVFHPLWRASIFNGFNFCRVYSDAVLADYQPQIFCLSDVKLAFIDINLYVKFLKFG